VATQSYQTQAFRQQTTGTARLARVLLRGLVFYWWSRASRYGIVGAASSDILPAASVTLFEAQATYIPTRLDGADDSASWAISSEIFSQ
jgi:hypothetical protein